MNTYQVAFSPGDSVGQELISQAKKVLNAVEKKCGILFSLFEFQSCTPAIEAYGTALREEDLQKAKQCRAILFGNLGNSSRQMERPELSPVYALKAARDAFHVFTNIRPVRIQPEYESLSPLKQSITSRGMDILIVRDLMGGMIAGDRQEHDGIHGREASDLEYYNESIVQHSATFAFEAAARRKKHVTSVDKANVLSSGKLWRQKVIEIGSCYPQITLDHDYVDYAAMELLVRPWEYDVILTSNVFGDILSDEIAQISGAPWMFGSGELAMGGRGIFTPNQLHHPRGAELAGKGLVCPYGVIDALSLLLRYSCNLPIAADLVDRAIKRAIHAHLFTGEAIPEGGVVVTTDELGDIIAQIIFDEYVP